MRHTCAIIQQLSMTGSFTHVFFCDKRERCQLWIEKVDSFKGHGLTVINISSLSYVHSYRKITQSENTMNMIHCSDWPFF